MKKGIEREIEKKVKKHKTERRRERNIFFTFLLCVIARLLYFKRWNIFVISCSFNVTN